MIDKSRNDQKWNKTMLASRDKIAKINGLKFLSHFSGN